VVVHVAAADQLEGVDAFGELVDSGGQEKSQDEDRSRERRTGIEPVLYF
jgi:hypothetical protein